MSSEPNPYQSPAATQPVLLPANTLRRLIGVALYPIAGMMGLYATAFFASLVVGLITESQDTLRLLNRQPGFPLAVAAVGCAAAGLFWLARRLRRVGMPSVKGFRPSDL